MLNRKVMLILIVKMFWKIIIVIAILSVISLSLRKKLEFKSLKISF